MQQKAPNQIAVQWIMLMKVSVEHNGKTVCPAIYASSAFHCELQGGLLCTLNGEQPASVEVQTSV